MKTNGATPPAVWPSQLIAAATNLGSQIQEGSGFVLIAWGEDGACKMQVAPVEMPLTNFVNLLKGLAVEVEKKLTVANALSQVEQRGVVQEPQALAQAPQAAQTKRKGGRPKGSKNKQSAPQAVN